MSKCGIKKCFSQTFLKFKNLKFALRRQAIAAPPLMNLGSPSAPVIPHFDSEHVGRAAGLVHIYDRYEFIYEFVLRQT